MTITQRIENAKHKYLEENSRYPNTLLLSASYAEKFTTECKVFYTIVEMSAFAEYQGMKIYVTKDTGVLRVGYTKTEGKCPTCGRGM